MSVYTFRFKAVENVTKLSKSIERSFGAMRKSSNLFGKSLLPVPKSVRRIDQQTEKLRRTQDRYNNSLRKSTSLSNGFLGSLGRFLPAIGAGYAIQQLTTNTVRLSDKLKIAERTILQVAGSQNSLNRATTIAQGLTKKTGNGYEEMLFGLSKMLPLAKGNVDQAGKLVTIASALQGIDPSQGFDGALFALKELESGDTVSLRERFGIRVPTQSEAKAIAKRDGGTAQDVMFGALENYIDTTFGQGQKGKGIEFLLTLNADTIAGQAKRTMNTLKGIIMPGIENINQPIVKLFKRFNGFLESNIKPIRAGISSVWSAVKPVFSGLFIGLKSIGESISKVWQNAKQGGFILNMLGGMKILLKGIGIGLVVTGNLIGWMLEKYVQMYDTVFLIGGNVVKFFQNLGTNVKGWIEQNNPFQFMIDVVDKVIPGFRAAMGGLWGWFKGLLSSLMNWVSKNIFQPFVDFFKPIFSGLENPLKGLNLSGTDSGDNKPKFDFIGNATRGGDLGGNARAGGLGGGIGLNQKLDNAVSGGGSVKNININIERLVEKFEIVTNNLNQAPGEIKEMIQKVLLDAVNDVNYAN